MSPDPHRVPVIVGVGQSINRDEIVTSRDLMEMAARAALAEAEGTAGRIQRVVTVDVINDNFPRPATALATRLALTNAICETTVVGGNTPQWLITRTAEGIANGEYDAVLLAGSEALASQKKARESVDPPSDPDAALLDGTADPVLGTDRFGLGEAEQSIRLFLPIHVYPMFESAMAAEAGRTFEEQRHFIARFMARNSAVAAKHPYAWFPTEATAEELATVTADNRMTAEPYTKRMNAIMQVDQGAAVVITSLAVARELGLADQAIHIWSGADATEVWCPVQRPDLAHSPGIRAAGGAALDAAGIGIDEVDHLDFYSCFPSAVQAGADALGVAIDDPRGLTVTGGLAYFGGPGNNYPMNAVATTVGLLREGGGLGLCTGLGWYTTKHSVGVYGADPAPEGFRRGDTSADQAAIDASELPVTLDASGPATVVASTVIYNREGEVATVPVFADLPDGRRIAANAHEDELAALAGVSLVGRTVQLVSTDPLVFRLDH
jgi:acetyl-CoA C-acetyltransferase